MNRCMPYHPPKPKRGWVVQWQWEKDHGIVNISSVGACGSIEEHPNPVRMYDKQGRAHYRNKNEKRAVRVKIGTYRGIVATASHYYADVEESHNAVLKLDTSFSEAYWTWAAFGDDDAGKGKHFHEKFNSRAAALAAIKVFIRENFKPETHEVHYGYLDTKQPNWWGDKS